MSSLDHHQLKVEPNDDDFFHTAASAQHPNDGSQFDMYDQPDSTLTILQDTYQVPFHAHTPYTQAVNGSLIGSPGGGSENFGKMSHPRRHKVPSAKSAAPRYHGGANSTGTTAARWDSDNCRRTRTTHNGRRSTSERRDRINERERDRMHMLCDAFEQLRQVLPIKRPKRGPHRQRLSKISTLLFAQNYIRTLEDILRNPAEYADCQLSPSDDAHSGNSACRSVHPSPAPTCDVSTEADYGALFNPSEFFHQKFSNDVFVDPAYVTF
ncbi:neurogenin-1-like [Acanthaster planci]|uniref:Neurogenin-1-like n=1 Tax=Acanthaster planci TaxID=133434 RepID=A0A8B7XJL3_ACAPL|nr:neurogenin-1-like [Acanthaster planci]